MEMTGSSRARGMLAKSGNVGRLCLRLHLLPPDPLGNHYEEAGVDVGEA